MDRQLLEINSFSKILMITSAGDNALDYLLDSPSWIHCVDINPRQNALLELKLALIKAGNFEDFKSLFVNAKSNRFRKIYSRIRPSLSSAAKSFWDYRIKYFNPNGTGFYYSGGSGIFARFLNAILHQKDIREDIQKLILEEKEVHREEIYQGIESKLWSGAHNYLWKRSAILSFAGIPKSQREAIGHLDDFMKRVIRNVFVKQSAKTNPYWRVYLEGKYDTGFTPDYLKEENYKSLKNSVDSITLTTDTLNGFLEKTDRKFTHFILLDHMDWLVEHDQEKLETLWKLIFEKSKLRAKVLFRTAHTNADFLPEFVHEKASIKQIDPDWVALNDRVGTYTGTYICTVNSEQLSFIQNENF